MPISERINPDNLNIHQFQETPETERPDLPFDVERDISSEMKQEIIDYWKERSLKSLDLAYLESLSEMMILWPEDDYTFITDQRLLKYLQSGADDLNLLAIEYYFIKIIRPNLETGLPPEQEINIKQQLSENPPSTMWGTVGLNTLNLAQPHTPDQLAAYNEQIQRARQNNDWASFARYHVVFKLSDPDNQPQITDADWQKLNEELIKEEGQLGAYLWLAAHMKVLAAYKVQLNNSIPGGVEFQMYPPEDVSTLTPSMPEQRKF